MKKITLKAYAQKHKLSIYNVMKMAKQKVLPTLSEMEDGNEVLYILEDENAVLPQRTEQKAEEKIQAAVEKQLRELRSEVQFLKNELHRLQKEVASIKRG